MIEALGEVLPKAVGIAISPMPLIALILMLISVRAKVTAPLFAVAIIIGILINTMIGFLIGGAFGNGGDEGPSTAASIFQVVLGVLFVALAVQQWRKRPRPGNEPEPPKMFAAIDSMSGRSAFGLGLLISAVNLKNLPLAISSGIDISQAGLSTGVGVLTVVVFTVIATLSMTIPVIVVLTVGERVSPELESVKEWLLAHNNAIMLVLFAVLGARALGAGVAGLV